MCGRRIKTSKANLFCSSLVKSDPTWLHPEELRFEAENTPIVSLLIEEWNEACRWKYFHIFRAMVISLWNPLSLVRSGEYLPLICDADLGAGC